MDDGSLSANLDAIRDDLAERIAERAVRPQRGDGLDPDLQLRIVSEITEALNGLGIRPFIMSGTLLGAVRDGGFLEHDYDIDLGLLPGADVDVVIDALRRRGSYDVSVLGPRIVAVHDSGVSVDLFEHVERDGKFWHATRIHEWWNTPFTVAPFELGSHTLWAPHDPSLYLDENYGDWSNPVAFYDISFDTPNRRYLHNFDAARFLHSRVIRALESGDRWLVESAVRELRDAFGIDLTTHLAASPLLWPPRNPGASADSFS